MRLAVVAITDISHLLNRATFSAYTLRLLAATRHALWHLREFVCVFEMPAWRLSMVSTGPWTSRGAPSRPLGTAPHTGQ